MDEFERDRDGFRKATLAWEEMPRKTFFTCASKTCGEKCQKTRSVLNKWPAAAVIPAPIAYIKVVAVKKLVVGFRGSLCNSHAVDTCLLSGWARHSSKGGGSKRVRERPLRAGPIFIFLEDVTGS